MCTMKTAGLALMLCALCTAAWGQPAAAPLGQGARLASLDQQGFLQLLVARSVEVRFGLLNSEVTRSLMLGEAGQYETVLFVSRRQEGRERQRTAEERTSSNPLNAGTAVLDELALTNELGFRNKLPWGTEISLSHRRVKKTNNLIPLYNDEGVDTDHNAFLTLTLKQPLLRNAGTRVTETDLRVAELEHQISLHQLQQQTQKAAIDGLNVFWQLYRAEASTELRRQAVASTEALLADAQGRVAAGKLPESAVLELQGVLLSRQAELLRSQQALREAQGKLANALHLVWSGEQALGTRPRLQAIDAPLPSAVAEATQAIESWAPYKVAVLKLQQALVRRHYAHNQTLPLADFVLSYGGTGYDQEARGARDAANRSRYPDWYMGINFEFPLQGNQRARQQLLAQNHRLTQAELEINAIKISFFNDLTSFYSDLVQSRAVVLASHKDLDMRQTLLKHEEERHRIGVGLLGTLVQRQIDLTEAQQRLLENQIRFELALSNWHYIQGQFFSTFHIHVDGLTTASAATHHAH